MGNGEEVGGGRWEVGRGGGSGIRGRRGGQQGRKETRALGMRKYRGGGVDGRGGGYIEGNGDEADVDGAIAPAARWFSGECVADRGNDNWLVQYEKPKVDESSGEVNAPQQTYTVTTGQNTVLYCRL